MLSNNSVLLLVGLCQLPCTREVSRVMPSEGSDGYRGQCMGSVGTGGGVRQWQGPMVGRGEALQAARGRERSPPSPPQNTKAKKSEHKIQNSTFKTQHRATNQKKKKRQRQQENKKTRCCLENKRKKRKKKKKKKKEKEKEEKEKEKERKKKKKKNMKRG